MSSISTPPSDKDTRLVDNIVHFCQALRKAGVKLSTAQVLNATRALATLGFTNKVDFYHTLRATLITNEENLAVFHQVFSLFWRDPDFLKNMMYQLAPTLRDEKLETAMPAANKRATEALNNRSDRREVPPKEAVEKDALLTMSAAELLRHKDFEQMSVTELYEAKDAIKKLSFDAPYTPTRRYRRSHTGNLTDLSSTLKRALMQGGEIQGIEKKSPLKRPPNLVVICDISGSMSVYSRMFMRFLHALMHARVRHWNKVSAFTFGTRLTNVSRALKQSDVDIALALAGHQVKDWEGGTRIGEALKHFNKNWARRVLGGKTVVLLITDGLERGETGLLATEMKQLSLFSTRLVWLNPLLRWEGFTPRAKGIQTILPLVDSFHTCHSLNSLTDLANALSNRGELDRMRAIVQANSDKLFN